ncbi:MAG: MMPL family transporter [Actinobacteria bacterium]|nr:MMPL family transporter [Actinomycetota bacterium]
MPEALTRAILRHRVAVVAAWAAVVVVGGLAAAVLPARLATTFDVPGTEAQRAQQVLLRVFRESQDGSFTVVVRARRPTPALRRELAVAARAVPTGHLAPPFQASGGIAFVEVATKLNLQHAKGWTEALRRALPPGALVTGQPALQHDLEHVLSGDLRRGEAIAVPAALLILLLVLGVSAAVLVPFAVAAATVTGTLGIVWLLAHAVTLVSLVPNLVELVGIGLAIDYSLLVVMRFREELERGAEVDDAVVRTASTAGRAVLVSGTTVAIGLALLLLVPVPFIRSLGIAGLLVPVLAIAVAATLQPALLSLLGRRALGHGPVRTEAFWDRYAAAVMRRPVPFLAVGTAVLVAAAIPALWLALTPGSFRTLPTGPQSVTALRLMTSRAGAGALTPVQVVVDSGRPGSALSPPVHAAVERLADIAFHDREAYVTALGPKPPYVDATRRYARVLVVGRHEYGDPASRALVGRLRADVRAARFPEGTRVLVGGAPAQGKDFLDRTYGAFPWLVAGVLALTLVVLLRGFRSVVLPVKAVLLNVLSVAAVYGLLVAIFQWGVGDPQIEAWIPIFLFALLFGLSMDYEVFLVTRMREAWDELGDNRRAVSLGLVRSGRVVTAAAAIMVATFMGFAAGRIEGLRQFGVGLALGVLIDATIVRAVLVPSAMALLGRWNWWLPGRRGEA